MNTSWRVKLKTQQDLKKKGIKLLYERIQLLIEIYQDSDFIDYCAENDLEPLELLDGELDDTQISFLTLKAVYDAFPDESNWESGRFSQMVATVREGQRKTREPRNSFSWKERALKAEAENEQLRKEIHQLQARIEELDKVIELLASGGGKRTLQTQA